MNIGNNQNIAINILVIVVIIMSILGTTSFVLFFTHCPPSCNVSNKESFYTDSFKHGNKHGNKQQNKQRNISQIKSQPHEYATQLIPIEDLFNDDL